MVEDFPHVVRSILTLIRNAIHIFSSANLPIVYVDCPAISFFTSYLDKTTLLSTIGFNWLFDKANIEIFEGRSQDARKSKIDWH